MPGPGSASLADVNKTACDHRRAFRPTDTDYDAEAVPSALTVLHQKSICLSSAPMKCFEKKQQQQQQK